MTYKLKDFVELEYTGKLEDGTVFDTTDEKVGKESGLGNESTVFGPAVICLGEAHIIPGIENKIIGKDPKSFTIELQPEDAFGKKETKLLKLMPMKVFKKQEIQPFPGLEVNIDNNYGTVRTVSGGRVIVDFNHPLSGRVVIYEVKNIKKVTELLDKVKAVFKNELNITDEIIEVKEKKVIINEEKFPKEVLDNVKKRVKELIPEVKDVLLKKDYKPPKK